MSGSINGLPGAGVASSALGAYSAVERSTPPAQAAATATGGGERAPRPAAEPAAPPPSREAVQAAVKVLNRNLGELRSTQVQFAIDDEYGAMVIKVTDAQTQEVIRQIPPESMLALAKFFTEQEAAREAGNETRQSPAEHGYGQAGQALVEGLLIQVQA